MPDEERAIDNYLNDILNARYGEQVRSAIYNSIKYSYDDTEAGIMRAESRTEEVLGSVPSQVASIVGSQIAAWNSDYISQWITKIDSEPNGWLYKFGSWSAAYDAWASYFDMASSTSWPNTFSGWNTTFSKWQSSFTQLYTSTETVRDQASDKGDYAKSAGDEAMNLVNASISSELIGGSASMHVELDKSTTPWNLKFYLRKGDPGSAYMIKGGPFTSVEALEATITDPLEGDCYEVGSSAPYTVYRWTGSGGTWNNEGTISTTPLSSEAIDESWDAQNTTVGDEGRFLNGRGLTYFIINKLRPTFQPKEPGKGLSTIDFNSTWTNLINQHTIAIDNRVVKDGTKVLSTNDYTNEEKNKLAAIVPSDSAPLMDGTASAGSSVSYSRADHRHPRDTNQILYFKNQPVSQAISMAQIALIEDSRITADSVVLSCHINNEEYALSDSILWNSTAGSITFTGMMAAVTTMDVIVGLKGN